MSKPSDDAVDELSVGYAVYMVANNNLEVVQVRNDGI